MKNYQISESVVPMPSFLSAAADKPATERRRLISASSASVRSPQTAARATFALKEGLRILPFVLTWSLTEFIVSEHYTFNSRENLSSQYKPPRSILFRNIIDTCIVVI